MALVIILSGNSAGGAEGKQEKVGDREVLFTERGVITGLGFGHIPEGKYQPILLIVHLGIDLKKYYPALQNNRGCLSFYAEPQFNPVIDPRIDSECGVGLGIQYTYPFRNGFSAYIMGGIGPHYISVVTEKQANGFLWSDVIGTGFYYHLTKNSALNAGYRFRHLSNSSFAIPNGGINANIVIIGYAVFFE
jgi:hypothetical protein